MRLTLVVLASVSTCLLEPSPHVDQAADRAKPPDAAVDRTRKTVRMLDDIYKTAVVLITEHYVNDEDDLPAGTAAIALFQAIKKKGWHEVRLLDASGQPLNDKNTARDKFDRTAIEKLKSGSSYYDEVEERGRNRYLRAATPIPVVLKKCVMCHPNYAGVAVDNPIGLLSYTIKIE